jgi:endonuclease/exonuclease/phosphatase (EEP) superfamily protein YafD
MPMKAWKPLLSYSLFATIWGLGAIALLTSRYGWPIYLELLSHFQVQYFVLSLLLLALLCYLRHKWLILLSAFIVAVQSLQILPWYLPHQGQAIAQPANLRFLIANLNTQNRSFDRVLSFIRQEAPDLALLIEVNQAWLEQLNSLEDILPYQFGQANPDNLRIALYSRQPLINAQANTFETARNAGIITNLTINGQSLTLLGIHPPPPIKPFWFQIRNRQLDAIARYVQTQSTPVLVAGDFNATMWSPYFQRLMQKTQLHDTRQGFGILPSWPVPVSYQPIFPGMSRLLGIPIDHCLVSPTLKTVNIRIGPQLDSDHRPLIVDLLVEGRSPSEP